MELRTQKEVTSRLQSVLITLLYLKITVVKCTQQQSIQAVGCRRKLYELYIDANIQDFYGHSPRFVSLSIYFAQKILVRRKERTGPQFELVKISNQETLPKLAFYNKYGNHHFNTSEFKFIATFTSRCSSSFHKVLNRSDSVFTIYFFKSKTDIKSYRKLRS